MADNTIIGTSGNDVLQTPSGPETNEVYGGDGNDFIVDSGLFGNLDTFYGGAGDDEILAGSGNDIIDTGTGNDNATGSEGDDTFLIFDNFGEDSLIGGEFAEFNGGDVLDASGMTTDATLTFGVDFGTPDDGDGTDPGGGGDTGGGPPPPPPPPPGGGGGDSAASGATLESGTGNLAEIQEMESFLLGSGNDTVIDDAGDNIVNMGAGDDQFVITDDFGADTITGGNGGETLGDLVDGSAITGNVTVDFTNVGTGTFTDGIDTLNFDEIERVETGAGTDTIYGGAGAQSIDANAGDDVFFIDAGFDGDFYRGGEGDETAGDLFDASSLSDDMTVTYTGDDATLTDGAGTMGFAEIEQLVLGAGNDTVTGDTGNESLLAGAGNDTFAVNDNFGTDTVDLGTGDNDIDGSGLTTDATIAFTANGVGTLESGANTVNFTGADTVATGAGNDSFASSGLNETIATNAGDDTVTLSDGFGTDSWDAGTGGETTGDRLVADTLSADTTVTFNDDGSGSLDDGTSTLAFQDVERVETGAGDDTITGSTGNQSIAAGDGDDSFLIGDNFGTDIYAAGSGGETTGDRLDATAQTAGVTVTLTNNTSGTLTEGANSLSFSDVEEISLGSGNDTVIGSGDGDDVLTNGGDDSFVLADGFGTDTVSLGEGGETDGDVLDGAALTLDAVVDISAQDTGTLTAGGDIASFENVERIITGSGNDTVTGSAGNDHITTGAGNDVIDASFGGDTIFAGAGDDTITMSEFDSATDRIDGGDDTDTLILSPADGRNFNIDMTTLTANGDWNIIDSMAGAQQVKNVENITTSDGNDTIIGDNGDNVFITGDGNDSVSAGAGSDTIFGGAGNDILDGGSDADTIFAGGGNDTVTFGSGDSLDGGSGNDTLTSAADPSAQTVTFSSDTSGSAGTASFTDFEVVQTGDGDDTFDATLATGGVSILSGAGDDTVIGGTGSDNLSLGSGDDTLTITAGFGNDLVDFGGENGGGDTLAAQSLTTDISVDFANGSNGTFSDGADLLEFSDLENVLTGSGNDTITGNTDSNTADTGAGDDTFIVADNFGNDTFLAGELGETNGDRIDASAQTSGATVTFSAPEAGTLQSGTDTLSFSDVERLETGAGGDTITGSTGNETLVTNDGNDRFVISDGFGTDSLSAGSGFDRIEANALTTDTTLDFSAGSDGTLNSAGNSLTFSSVEDVNLGSGNDTITGSSGDQSISGGSGNDTIILADNFGNDEFTGQSGDDAIDASALTDDVTLTFTDSEDGTLAAGTSQIAFDNVEGIATGSGNDTVIGNTGDDVVSTNAGDDTFVVSDNFGNDVFLAGELGETDGDRIDASAMAAGTTIVFSAAEDGTLTNGGNTLNFSDVEILETGSGADTITGSTGDEVLITNGGNDRFVISDGFGTDSIDAGSGTDQIDASALSTDTTATFSAGPDGTITTGGDSVTFKNVEDIRLGAGNDAITGSSADQTVFGGAGNDSFAISDNFGIDVFEGEGGTDTLDASALSDDATVSMTGAGDGTLDADGSQASFGDVEDIQTGSGNDTIFGGSGNDTLTTNAGDDTFVLNAGFGTDSFDAGSTGETSGDTIDASNISADITADLAGTLQASGDTLSFSDVENIITGSGEDDITGTSADETVFGGNGDDIFRVSNGFGTDRFVAGEGAGSTSDVLDASAVTGGIQVNFSADEAGVLSFGSNTVTFENVEEIQTGSTNDRVVGSDGNDRVYTNDGDDLIFGGGGRDTFYAGAGNDRINFAEGDSVQGGAGDDLFILEDTGETGNFTINIDGGSESTTGQDVLRLGRLADLDTLTSTSDASGSMTGSVTLKDGTLLNFTDIENVICFTPGTMIATPHGPRDIARLRVGDMVRTRDHGAQPIRWIQKRTVPAIDRFAPVRIKAGVLDGLHTDLLVSPQHRMLLTGYKAQLLFGDDEVLVSATHLVNGADVTQDSGGDVTYIHMMFDTHEVVTANGALSESFHPGAVGLTGITAPAREELFTLFPSLRSNPNGYGQTARRCLRRHETLLLTA